MKKGLIIASVIAATTGLLSSCGGNERQPGRTYVPDMAYSRAYEAYAQLDSNLFTQDAGKKGGRIFYNAMTPVGAIKRGDLFDMNVPVDSNGYKMSAAIRNPLDSIKLSAADMKEAERLFNINCGICHGAKGGGNGPIADKIGAVANLTLPLYKDMADGTMFYSITHGKNNMGSYASQLSIKQRWEMVKYIRVLQGGESAAADTSATATAAAAAGPAVPATDTTKTK